jgi:hypothetical protein
MNANMSGVEERLAHIQGRIAKAAAAARRDPAEVTLIAVSKEQPEELVREAYALGVRDFGENRVQALIKRMGLGLEGVRWHLIGPVQTNKAKELARHPPTLLHTVDRPALVDALEAAFSKVGMRLPCLVQVNIDAEPQKAGVSAEGLAALIDAVEAAPHLELRGLMAIPRPLDEVGPAALSSSFEAMANLLGMVRARIGQTATLSLGMSDDFELAIAAGATHVRVGSALFGERPIR